MSKELDLRECYHKGDRQREFDRASIPGVLKSLNHTHQVNQSIIKVLNRVQQQQANLKLRNGIAVAAVTAVLTRAPEIYAWLHRLFF